MRGSTQPIKFSGEYITLELQHPLCVDNWMITPESTPLKVLIFKINTMYTQEYFLQICKSDVDNYKFQKCDASRDSISCNILLQWNGEEDKAKPLKSHILTIWGTTEEDCSFTIHYYPKRIDGGAAHIQEKNKKTVNRSKHLLVSKSKLSSLKLVLL